MVAGGNERTGHEITNVYDLLFRIFSELSVNKEIEDVKFRAVTTREKRNVIAKIREGVLDLDSFDALVVKHIVNRIAENTALDGVQDIKTLKLSSAELTAIPSGIAKLHWLENLDLSYNSLSAMDNIEAIPSGLETSQRGLETLPSGLKTLRLSSAELTKIPSGIAKLHLLENLDLSHNSLSAMDSIEALPSGLKTLRLSSAELTKIPSGIAKLHLLENLDLSHNDFAVIYGINALPRGLKTLNLSHNDDLHMIFDLVIPESLEELDLSNSEKFENIPDEVLLYENCKFNFKNTLLETKCSQTETNQAQGRANEPLPRSQSNESENAGAAEAQEPTRFAEALQGDSPSNQVRTK